mmetsp:Transcript_3360/g.13421  ORF Transcript_3360/g.13421 Transcript_3360/m.13421 type:complete len:102 (+) Transcript_3360:895-1200(+)
MAPEAGVRSTEGGPQTQLPDVEEAETGQGQAELLRMRWCNPHGNNVNSGKDKNTNANSNINITIDCFTSCLPLLWGGTHEPSPSHCEASRRLRGLSRGSSC